MLGGRGWFRVRPVGIRPPEGLPVSYFGLLLAERQAGALSAGCQLWDGSCFRGQLPVEKIRGAWRGGGWAQMPPPVTVCLRLYSM